MLLMTVLAPHRSPGSTHFSHRSVGSARQSHRESFLIPHVGDQFVFHFRSVNHSPDSGGDGGLVEKNVILLVAGSLAVGDDEAVALHGVEKFNVADHAGTSGWSRRRRKAT